MPNHVKNMLVFHGVAQEIAKLRQSIKPDQENGQEPGVIDFNKIIPMPEFIDKVCIGHTTLNGEHVSNWIQDKDGNMRKLTPEEQAVIDKYGDWYSWSIANWHTKWNAYSQKEISANKITFETAWSAPIPVIQKLAEMFPKITIYHQWADEDIGYNVGSYEIKDNVMTEENIPEGGTLEAYDLAFELWPNDKQYYRQENDRYVPADID